MLDGISFEETGKPAVVVATTNFVRLATSIKQSMHLEDFPVVVVPHPLGDRAVAGDKARLCAAYGQRAGARSCVCAGFVRGDIYRRQYGGGVAHRRCCIVRVL